MSMTKEAFSTALNHKFSERELAVIWHDMNLYKTLEHISQQECIERLLKDEPFQYITGSCYFYDLDLFVSPATLIPRPETEELVYKVVQSHMSRSPKILDIGTGSGCIGLCLKKQISQASVSLLDVSPIALQIAQKNAQRHQLDVELIELDILSVDKLTDNYDIIVSNPPYIPNKEKSLMSDNVLAYEPHMALFVDDDDPLLFYRKIAEIGQQNLNNHGELYFESNEYNVNEVASMLNEMKYHNVDIHSDMQGKPRMISCALSAKK